MAIKVKVPKISEGVESATVAEVLVSEGDTIKEEQSIIAVETDKASVEVPSSDGGKVKEIKVKEGDEIKVGDVILILEGEGEEEDEPEEEGEDKEKEEEDKDKKAKKKEEGEKEGEDKEEKERDEEDKEKAEKEEEEGNEKKEKKAEKEEKEDKEDEKESEEEDQKGKEEDDKKAQKEEKEKDEKKDKDKEKKETGKDEKKAHKEKEEGEEEAEVPASPAVRRLARELGVNIQALDGSGPGGRITEEDVKSRTKQKEERGTGAPTKPPLPDFSQWGPVERQALSGIRKATARNTLASWQSIPHVTQFDEADVSGIEEYMQKMQEKAEEAGGKLTLTAVLLKIAANALQQFPKFNASIDMENEEVILKKYIHLGMAVDTEKGLLLPVIRDVNKKSILELSVEITEIAEKARAGKLSPEEMQGGNFSISNLGGIGGTNFTPVVYHPQVAILGISRTATKPVFIEGSFEPRQILPLSLSYDHRLIDGAEGAKFLRWICQALEDPYKALLGA